MARRMVTLIAVAVLVPGLAAAGTLSISPSFRSVQIGTPVSVDLVYEGIPPLVGAFDVDVRWNPGILNLTEVVFHDSLGDLSSVEDLWGESANGPGERNIFEVSLLSSQRLAELQGAGPIVFATIHFDTIGTGISAVEFPITPHREMTITNDLGSVMTSTFVDGGVEVTEAPPVPEPAGIVLLLSGAGAIAWFRHGAA